jgi:hypothetical protein
MTPTPARPAAEAYRRHEAACPSHGDLKRCSVCRGLEMDASAEDWARWGRR